MKKIILVLLIATVLIIGGCEKMVMELTSSAFEHNGKIPSRYTCDGENLNPALAISNVPEGTKSFVLIMDDPDIPDFVKKDRGIEVFDHWVMFNIPADTREVSERAGPRGSKGKNSKGTLGYTGPCPPDREHRYFFKLYALDKKLDLFEGATKEEVEKAMGGHVIEKTELIGLYERTQ